MSIALLCLSVALSVAACVVAILSHWALAYWTGESTKTIEKELFTFSRGYHESRMDRVEERVGRMEKRETLNYEQLVKIGNDKCPNCDGELDTGWECNDCGADWFKWSTPARELVGRK